MQRYLPLLLAVLVATIGTFLWWQSTLGFSAFTWESYRRLQVADHPVSVPNTVLENQQGQLLDIVSLRGKVLVINFIYTRCPTVCGYTGHIFSQLQTTLIKRGYENSVQLLSISLDPQYDSPTKLKAYMQRFSKRDSNWQVTRPNNPLQGQALLHDLGIVSIADGFGGFIHNAATHIVDQRGQLVKIIDEDKPDLVLRAIERLIKKSAPPIS